MPNKYVRLLPLCLIYRYIALEPDNYVKTALVNIWDLPLYQMNSYLLDKYLKLLPCVGKYMKLYCHFTKEMWKLVSSECVNVNQTNLRRICTLYHVTPVKVYTCICAFRALYTEEKGMPSLLVHFAFNCHIIQFIYCTSLFIMLYSTQRDVPFCKLINVSSQLSLVILSY